MCVLSNRNISAENKVSQKDIRKKTTAILILISQEKNLSQTIKFIKNKENIIIIRMVIKEQQVKAGKSCSSFPINFLIPLLDAGAF